jgi:hypothetical protein
VPAAAADAVVDRVADDQARPAPADLTARGARGPDLRGPAGTAGPDGAVGPQPSSLLMSRTAPLSALVAIAA